MDSFFATLGIHKLSIVMAGAIGGTVSLRHYSDLTYKGRALVVLSSVALANYATPVVVHYFGEAAEEFELGIAAGIGLFGLSIVSSVMNVIQDTEFWKKTFQGMFTRKLP